MSVFENTILENILLNEYVKFITILFVTIIFVAIFHFILKLIVKEIAGTKKRYGEYILKKLSKPILLIAFFTGLYASLRVLSALNEYYNLIDKIFFIIIALLCALLVSNMVKVAIVAYLKIRKKFEGTPRLLDKAISVIIFTSNFRIF